METRQLLDPYTVTETTEILDLYTDLNQGAAYFLYLYNETDGPIYFKRTSDTVSSVFCLPNTSLRYGPVLGSSYVDMEVFVAGTGDVHLNLELIASENGR